MVSGLEKTLNFASYKCQALSYIALGIPIVFLHGLSYTSEVWQRISVTELLMKKRVPFLALDMPYGLKSRCQPKTRTPEKNIAFVNEAVKTLFGSENPILVGASIGGNMALQYAAKYPVKGLLLVAPARALEPNLVQSYSQFKFSTTIIWGSEDNIIASEDMRTLADKLPNTRLIIYDNATHSAYKDQPDRFKHDLLELYANAE
jgi:pimeloyl-ACP methyl ester carboxylesterase